MFSKVAALLLQNKVKQSPCLPVTPLCSLVKRLSVFSCPQSPMAASCQQSNCFYLMGWRPADEASKLPLPS